MQSDLNHEVAQQVARGDGLVAQLAEKLGGQARATAIFGEPVERDGVTVIPVARARWGFGGGGGQAANEGFGSGGGGGMTLAPVGYIEISHGETRFQRIRDPLALLPPLLASAAALLLVIRALTRTGRR